MAAWVLRQVDQGNYVTPGDANGIVVVTELHPVLFTVPEDNVPSIMGQIKSGTTLGVVANGPCQCGTSG